jgi:hypothetical protein
VDRERPAEQDGTDAGEGATRGGPRLGRGLAGDELALVGVAEERGVRAVDADAAVAELAAGDRDVPVSPAGRRSG